MSYLEIDDDELISEKNGSKEYLLGLPRQHTHPTLKPTDTNKDKEEIFIDCFLFLA